MVYIIKKLKSESIEELFNRVAALMLNMEYGISIYDIENGIVVNDDQKQFNVQEYEYFTDTYTFECGSVIVMDNLQEYPRGIDLESKLNIFTNNLDIYKDETFYKPYNTASGFETTQYTVLWGKAPKNRNKRNIRYSPTNNYVNVILEKDKHAFLWNICPAKCLGKRDEKYYTDIFRSLSTIIVDVHDIIKYDENMKLIDPSIRLIKNYNFPTKYQIQVQDKCIFNYNINISKRMGVEMELWNKNNKWTSYNVRNFDKYSIKVHCVEYEDLNLLIAASGRFIDFEDLFYRDCGERKCDKTPIDKLGTEISDYDRCTECRGILFEDFYILEKKRTDLPSDSTKMDMTPIQYAICKFCSHYTDSLVAAVRRVDNVSVLRSKIPRDLNQAIDLTCCTERMTPDDTRLYKFLLKIINKNFPKKIENTHMSRVGNININDDIVLCNNFNVWENLDFILKTDYKIIVPIKFISEYYESANSNHY